MRAMLLCLAMLCLSLTPVQAATYHIDAEGTGDFPTIQEAIDAAADGDSILLADGNYTGDGNDGLRAEQIGLTLASASGDAVACVIDCEETDTGISFVGPAPSGSRLEGITIRRALATGVRVAEADLVMENCVIRDGLDCVALFLSGGEAELLDCWLRDNVGAHAGGGVGGVNGSISATGCVFTGNSNLSSGGAVRADFQLSLALTSCTLHGNSADSGAGGVHAGQGAVVELDRCIVSGSTAGEAISDGGATLIALSCCDLFGNAGGDWTGGIADQLGVDGNISEDPRYCDANIWDLTLVSDSPCAAENNAECGQIGALPVGCTASSVPEDWRAEASSWSLVKGLFR